MRIGLVVCAASLVAPSAWAQAPAQHTAPLTAAHPATARPGAPPNPKKLLVSAQAKRAAGDFEGALADYRASDALAPSPATVEGIAFCHDKLGHFADALTWYEGFLSNIPSTMQLEAGDAKVRVDAIKAMPGHLHLESTPGNAFVLVDGREQPTHTPLDVDLAPGKHTLHLTAPDHDAVDKDIEVASRVKQNLALELPLTPPPPPPPPVVVVAPPPPPPPPRSVLPAIITGGLAIVSVGIGAGFGGAALHQKSLFNAHPTNDIANTGENDALIADMGFGIGLTLGVTAVVLYTTRNEPASGGAGGETPAPGTAAPPAKTSTSVPPVTFAAAPYLTPHGGGAGALLRF